MKIQNSEGQTIEVPRHLRKAVKKMLSNNQHDEISQIFGCGGMVDPITGGKPPLYGEGGETKAPEGEVPYSHISTFMDAYNAHQDSIGWYKHQIPFNEKFDSFGSTKEKLDYYNSPEGQALQDSASHYRDNIINRNVRNGMPLDRMEIQPMLPKTKPVYRPQHGLGGTIGSLLSTAAPIASLIPGVGTAVGVGAGILGAGLQALDSSSGGSQGGSPQRGVPMQHMSNYAPTGFAEGGETGLVPINIEGHNIKNISMSQAKKGELLVHQGRVHKNYISRPPHPAEGQNPLGNDEVPQGLIVIPKDRSTEYLNAGRALRKQIEASVVSQQVAREGNMMRKGGQAGRSKMLPGGMAKDYFDREYPYAPSLNPNVNSTQVQDAGPNFMLGDPYTNARNGLPASYNNMTPMTPRNPFNSGYGQNLRTQMSNQGDVSNPYGQGTPEEGDEKPKMSPFDKMNLGQFGLSMIPAIGDIMDMTAAVQTPNYQTMRGITPDLIDPSTGQAQVNQAYRTGANSLRDSGVYSIKSNRNLVADRMYNSGTQAIDIANRNVGIKNQFKGINADINKFNVGISNQAEDIKMMGQAKRREARRNLLDRAPAAASQYMQNGLYAKMLGI